MQPDPGHPGYILTPRGTGYCLTRAWTGTSRIVTVLLPAINQFVTLISYTDYGSDHMPVPKSKRKGGERDVVHAA